MSEQTSSKGKVSRVSRGDEGSVLRKGLSVRCTVNALTRGTKWGWVGGYTELQSDPVFNEMRPEHLELIVVT